MKFHPSPFHHSSSSPSSSKQGGRPGLTAGIVQAGQALGSIGMSGTTTTASGIHRNHHQLDETSQHPRRPLSSKSSSTLAGSPGSADRADNNVKYAPPPPSDATAAATATAGHSAPPPAYGLASASSTQPSSSSFVNASSSSAAMSQLPQFDTPRRSQPPSRNADELHMASGAGGMALRGQMSPRDYSSGAPRISLEQSTPEGSSQYHAASTSQLPGALQAGGHRPPAMTVNTAPTIPTVPSQQPPQPDPYSTPSRPPALTTSHSYSRSSPATAFEGSYSAFSPIAGSEQSQFMSPSQKYTPSGQTRNVPNTPLGLADIRPRADSSLTDGLPGGPSYLEASSVPSSSNYVAPWATYALDWCKWPAQNHDAGKVAIGSYLEDGHNFIQILESQITPVSADSYNPNGSKYGIEFRKIAEATHSYPVTRLLWEPPSSTKQSTDLLATSGDHLRLWSLPSDTTMSSSSNSINRSANHGRDHVASKLTPLALLSNSKTPEHTAPLTSLDWNTVSPSLIITSSIDTTCTIWDIPTLTAKTQLIAHDKEVFDVRFCANSVDVFVSCGADGSVRMFDLRSLEHSTIIYEPTSKDDKDAATGGRISPTLAQQTMSYAPPLLRLAASPHDTHLLATFAQDSNIIRILDVRQPGQALLELRGHSANINCIEWCPTRRGTLASGADDCLVLVWDLLNQNNNMAAGHSNGSQDHGRGPTASWQCEYEVGNISWAPHSSLSNEGGDWIGVSAGRGVWGVKL